MKNYIFSDKKRTIAFLCSIFLTMALGASGYFIFRKHYAIHSSVQTGIYTVPIDAEFYVEIKNTLALKNILLQSETLKHLEANEAWSRFLSSLAGKKLGELLYLVELKSNSILDWKDFLELFGESIGYASFPDGSYSVVAKTNLKSKFGISMIESFKAEKIPLKKIKNTKNEKEEVKPHNETPTPEQSETEIPSDSEPIVENPSENIISSESYESGFLEEGIKSGNLIISQVEGNNGQVYFVLVGDYLFLSDSLETLTKTLETATNPSKKSLLAKKEMDLVFKEYYHEETLGILYLNLSDSNFTPFLKPIAENANSISLLFKMENNLVTANILTTERKPFPESNTISIESIQTSIPNDVLLAIYSHSLGLKEYIASILNPGESWIELALIAPEFFKKGNLTPEEYFTPNSGSVLLLHKPVYLEDEKFLYPNFSIGYISSKEDDSLLKTIFKPGKATNVTYLDTKYKFFKRNNSFYTPSLFKSGKMNWISSDVEMAKDCISARNGNKPTISDLNSSKISSPWKEAPHHIVLNWQRLQEDILTFLIYGGAKSGKYTEKTIQNDIQPLLESFNWIESIHISLGAKGKIYGKMIVSPM